MRLPYKRPHVIFVIWVSKKQTLIDFKTECHTKYWYCNYHVVTNYTLAQLAAVEH